MKKFISNIIAFLGIAFIFNIVVFIFANDNYYRDYTKIPDKKYKVFIMSDSHGASLEKFAEKYGVYNFSGNSDSYFDIERKINFLIRNNYKPERIFISADLHMLSPYREISNNMDKTIIYTSDFNFNYFNEKYIKYYFPILQVKINGLFRIYLEDKLKILLNQQQKTTNKVIWNKLSENEKLKRAEERIEGQFISKKPSQKLEKTFLNIIRICKNNNIELIGIQFPLSPSYLKKIGNRNYGADRILISNGLDVLNYRDIFKKDNAFFGDQDHLNAKGGQVFVNKVFEK